MINGLLDTFLKNVGVAGLLVSAGLLLLISSQNVFEVDSRIREDEDPAGGVVRRWEWRYMSDEAQNARGEVLSLANLLKAAVRVALLFAVGLAALMSIVLLLGWGSVKLANVSWCNSYVAVEYTCAAVRWGADHGEWLVSDDGFHDVAREGFAFVILLFSPIFIYRLGRLAQNVVLARRKHTQNKKPWWLAP
jgi:hypothetical protein